MGFRSDMTGLEQTIWATAYVSAFANDVESEFDVESAEKGVAFANRAVDALRQLHARQREQLAVEEKARNRVAADKAGIACTCFVKTDEALSDEWTWKRGVKHHFKCAMYSKESR